MNTYCAAAAGNLYTVARSLAKHTTAAAHAFAELKISIAIHRRLCLSPAFINSHPPSSS